MATKKKNPLTIRSLTLPASTVRLLLDRMETVTEQLSDLIASDAKHSSELAELSPKIKELQEDVHKLQSILYAAPDHPSVLARLSDVEKKLEDSCTKCGIECRGTKLIDSRIQEVKNLLGSTSGELADMRKTQNFLQLQEEKEEKEEKEKKNRWIGIRDTVLAHILSILAGALLFWLVNDKIKVFLQAPGG